MSMQSVCLGCNWFNPVLSRFCGCCTTALRGAMEVRPVYPSPLLLQ